MVGSGLEYKACGGLGGVDRPICKCDVNVSGECGETMLLSKVLSDEGDTCTRINHGSEGKSRVVGEQGDRNLNGCWSVDEGR